MPAHALALATCLGPVPGQNHRNICETPVLADNSRPFEPGGCVFTTTVHTNVNHCMISYALSEAGCQFSMLWRPPRNARSPSFRALIILTNRISRPKISAAAARLATTYRPDHGRTPTMARCRRFRRLRHAFDASGIPTSLTTSRTLTTTYVQTLTFHDTCARSKMLARPFLLLHLRETIM